jgi:hypothetical protein
MNTSSNVPKGWRLWLWVQNPPGAHVAYVKKEKKILI